MLMDLSVVESQVGEGSGVLVKVFFILHEVIRVISGIAGVGCCKGEMIDHTVLRLVSKCDVHVAVIIEVDTPVVTNLVALPDSGCAPFVGKTFLGDIQSCQNISVAVVVVLLEARQMRWWWTMQ